MAKKVAMNRNTQPYIETKRDYGMISEDRSAPCNLPREAIQKFWDRGEQATFGQQLDDLFHGSEEQVSQDMGKLKKASKPGKY